MKDTENGKLKINGIIIECSYDEIVGIEDLKPNPKNPYIHPTNQINRIAEIIKEQGWREPILVSRNSGMMVTGHGLLEVAKKLGMKKVPVTKQDFKSMTHELTHLIADNKLADLKKTDRAKLKDLIQEVDTGEINTDLTGFEYTDIEKLMTEFYVAADVEDILKEIDQSRAVDRPIWVVIRTNYTNKELLEKKLELLEENNIKIERSYEK